MTGFSSLSEAVGAAAGRPGPFLRWEQGAIDHAELAAWAGRFAAWLEAAGIAPGERVALKLGNVPEMALAYLATVAAGRVAVPVNLQLRAAETRYVLEHCGARVLVTDRARLDALDDALRGLPALSLVVLRDVEHGGTPPLGKLIERFAPRASSGTAPTAADVAMIVYTSGTTGRPKGAEIRHGNLLANARDVSAHLGLDERDAFGCVMPLFHANGIVLTLVTPLVLGARVRLVERFDPETLMDVVAAEGLTTFGSVATMLSRITHSVSAERARELDLSRLRFVLCGSAPVPVEVARPFEERFGTLVVEGYGLTETTCRSTFNPPDGERRLGSAGRPLGNELRVVDDAGRTLAAGEVGEIVMRGDNVFRGYHRDPEATRRAFRDGWFLSGDLGFLDADGFLHVVDRKTDMIIRAGENVYPREIDEVLFAHPAVREAACFGVPDPDLGEAVEAAVVAAEAVALDLDALDGWCRERLARYKCPRRFHVVDEIPRGPTGKLLKRALRDRFGAAG